MDNTHWILRTNDFRQSPLGTAIAACKKEELVALSLKRLGFFWGLALVSVFIPILHFVLVPAFLIAGVFAFFSQYKNTHLLRAGSYSCPACKNLFDIKDTYFFENKKIDCGLCSEQLTLITSGHSV